MFFIGLSESDTFRADVYGLDQHIICPAVKNTQQDKQQGYGQYYSAYKAETHNVLPPEIKTVNELSFK